MHDHGVNADQLHQYDVPGKAGFQRIVHHGVATKLDHHRGVLEMADVRQRFAQHLSDFSGALAGQGHVGIPQ